MFYVVASVSATATQRRHFYLAFVTPDGIIAKENRNEIILVGCLQRIRGILFVCVLLVTGRCTVNAVRSSHRAHSLNALSYQIDVKRK